MEQTLLHLLEYAAGPTSGINTAGDAKRIGVWRPSGFVAERPVTLNAPLRL